MTTYRVGNHQPQNVYRGEQYIGVMFTAEDAAEAVNAMNAYEQEYGPRPPADSCTCSFPAKTVADAILDDSWTCPVHQGRRARGPKPPPLGPGCICDGSGRTCPRHGAVI